MDSHNALATLQQSLHGDEVSAKNEKLVPPTKTVENKMNRMTGLVQKIRRLEVAPVNTAVNQWHHHRVEWAVQFESRRITCNTQNGGNLKIDDYKQQGVAGTSSHAEKFMGSYFLASYLDVHTIHNLSFKYVNRKRQRFSPHTT